MYRPTPILALATGLLTLAACGGDAEPQFDCTDHDDCLADEACLGEVCTDEPEAGDDCPDLEASSYDGLICEDATWVAAPADLNFTTQPPAEATAGTAFDVGVEVLGTDGEPTEVTDIEVTLEINQHEFATGDPTIGTSTGEAGVADFELAVLTAETGLVLTATADHDRIADLEVTSNTFDVLAADAVADHSAITGESGVPADGNTEADIEIELADEHANPVVGVVPQFTASGDGNEYQDCSETDEDGLADCAMTSTHPGDKTLEITDPVQTTGETIEFELACFDADDFGGGDGTADNPFRICTPEHLVGVGDGSHFVDDNFVLVEDVDMTDNDQFNVIGDADDPFAGTFDGNDRTVENLTVEEPGQEKIGFFGVLSDDALVQNLTLEDVDIAAANEVGGLVGKGAGEIQNVSVSGEVRGDDQTNRPDGFGGLAGVMTGTVTDAQAHCDVEAAERVGGLAGDLIDADVERARATGDGVADENHIGGFAGRIDGGSIERSYATGDVSAPDADNGHGGFAGTTFGSATISDSYATGDVDSGGQQVGGFVGLQHDSSIIDSYSTGFVEGDDATGGFVGYFNADSSTVETSYWDADTSGKSPDEGVGDYDDDLDGPDISALTIGHFGDESNFEDWDFDDTWVIDEAPDGVQRPLLQWQ